MPFQEGNTLGKGRPNKRPISDALRALLSRDPEDNEPIEKLTNVHLIARKLIDSAKEGKLDAIRELIDRIEGKPKQALVGDDEDDPINHAITIFSGVPRCKKSGPDTNQENNSSNSTPESKDGQP